ncbi:MAG: ThiF family adenylyltransferase [Thermoleophilia bacterium]|nr:ThiF family adenylyltransferase [Thermoleophilia bacterium]
MTGPLHQRLEGLYDVAALREKRVVMVGLGSGGSTVALELAKAGVGRFALVDPDRLEETNFLRHECDGRYLSWNKAVAVADLIRHRDPRTQVEALLADVFALGEELEQLVGDADLVAVCTDSEPSKHLLNELCTAAATPAVYAGVYARAAGGEVIRCAGGPDDACYACVVSVLKATAPIQIDESNLRYGVIDADAGLHGAPGLGLDVRLIALLHAKVCLATLVPELGLEANVVLFGNQALKGLFPRPLASALVQVARQETCMVCQPLRGELAGAAARAEVRAAAPAHRKRARRPRTLRQPRAANP